MKDLICQKKNLELNSMKHRQPVKIIKNWCYMIIFFSPGNKPGCRVLYILKILNKIEWKTIQEGVAVIKL